MPIHALTAEHGLQFHLCCVRGLEYGVLALCINHHSLCLNMKVKLEGMRGSFDDPFSYGLLPNDTPTYQAETGKTTDENNSR